MNLIKNDELDAILADMKLVWETLAAVAMQAPGAAEIVGPRSKVPVVIDMVFEQAKAPRANVIALVKELRDYPAGSYLRCGFCPAKSPGDHSEKCITRRLLAALEGDGTEQR